MRGDQKNFQLDLINENQNRNSIQNRDKNSSVAESTLKRVKFDLAIQKTIEGDFDEKGL